MVKQRFSRLLGAMLLLAMGVQGLLSPLTQLALSRTMPDCLEVGPVAAAVGMEVHVLAAGPECPHGTYAPAPTYHVVAQAALTASLTAVLLGIAALLLAIGVGLRARRVVRDVRQWFTRRFRTVVTVVAQLVVGREQPIMVPVTVAPARLTSSPHVRRGPPSCSC